MTIDQTPALLLFYTVAVYWFANHLRARTGSVWLNPVLIATTAVIALLYATGTGYEKYHTAAEFIDFWLQPAVVCLAVPLYRQWPSIRKQWLPILVSQLAGSITGIVSVVWLARLFGGDQMLVLSLAAKSVTNPIALEITKSVGGIPPITAASVILAGILGQMVGFRALAAAHVRNPASRGLSVGTASHAIGLGAALQRSRKTAAYAGLGMIFNGILTAILVPLLLPLL